MIKELIKRNKKIISPYSINQKEQKGTQWIIEQLPLTATSAAKCGGRNIQSGGCIQSLNDKTINPLQYKIIVYLVYQSKHQMITL